MEQIEDINWKEVMTGAAIAGAGAALTYLSEFVASTDFGVWTPIVTAGLSSLVNLVRKYQQGAEG